MIAYLLALGAAAVYGGADFLGGLATRRSSILPVVVVSHSVGLGLLLLALPVLPESRPGAADLAWGAAAGLTGGVGIALLYQGLAAGVMSVVAPVTGVLGVAIPVLFALMFGEPNPEGACRVGADYPVRRVADTGGTGPASGVTGTLWRRSIVHAATRPAVCDRELRFYIGRGRNVRDRRSGGRRIHQRLRPARCFRHGAAAFFADAVVVGAGTLHGDPGHLRTAPFIFPETEGLFRELRRTLGKPALHPLNVIVSGSGRVDLREPTFHTPELETLILTSRAGLDRLEAEHGPAMSSTRVRAVANGPELPVQVILSVLYDEFGVRLLLHEGGPTLFGRFLTAGLVDELFLTLAPRVAGRLENDLRLSLAMGSAFPPERSPRWGLVTVKQVADQLFLRYRNSRHKVPPPRAARTPPL